jgi:hypothetical protein
VWPLEIVIQGASQISFKQEATEQAGLESSLLVRAAVMPPFFLPMPLEPRINANKHEFEKSKKPGAPSFAFFAKGGIFTGRASHSNNLGTKY